MVKIVAIASDHAGYELKAVLHPWLQAEGYTVVDLGAFNGSESVDYPDFAARLARGIRDAEFERGILVCGTGIGMAMMANRFPQVRAANCLNDFTARLAREVHLLSIPKERSTTPAEWRRLRPRLDHHRVTIHDDLGQGLTRAFNGGGTPLFTGSIYFLGEFYQWSRLSP